MASKMKGVKHDADSDRSAKTKRSARTVEKDFDFKRGEEIVDIRISLGAVPVVGGGPKPKMTVSVTLLPPKPKTKRSELLLKPEMLATGGASKLKKKKKKSESREDKPQTPVVGGGGKPRSPSP